MRTQASPARRAALAALCRVRNGTDPATSLNRVMERRRLEGPDRGLTTELVYGVLRRQGTLDWIIGLASRRPPHRTAPGVLDALRLGVYQMFYLRVPLHAAVSESVSLAPEGSGAAGFINAVLRRLAGDYGGETRRLPFPDAAGDPVGHISLVHSHPRWLVERWLGRLGPEETEALCRANNRAAPLAVRANRLRVSAPELAARLAAAGVKSRPAAHIDRALVLDLDRPLFVLSAYQEGLFIVQDEAPMLAGLIVAPRPGDLVLDVCAAPGGKTTHLAELMDDRGRVIAVDSSRRRLKAVTENCRRLGLTSVRTLAAPAAALAEEGFSAAAASVLVDAPCTNLGVLSRRPDARWRREPGDITRLAGLQLDILGDAAGCVRPGGVLVYSTCSTEPEENEQVVRGFLATHAGFVRDDPGPWLPDSLQGALTADGQVQLWPHRHGTDGFFICRLRRVRDAG